AVGERLAAHLRLHGVAVRRHASGQPNVAANRGAAPYRNASEDCRPRIDHDIVFNNRMAGLAFGESAAFVDRETLRAKGDRLIEPHAFADDGRLSDHNSGTVIDKKTGTYASSRMNVDAGLRVRQLRDDACDDRGSEHMQ